MRSALSIAMTAQGATPAPAPVPATKICRAAPDTGTRVARERTRETAGQWSADSRRAHDGTDRSNSENILRNAPESPNG